MKFIAIRQEAQEIVNCDPAQCEEKIRCLMGRGFNSFAVFDARIPIAIEGLYEDPYRGGAVRQFTTNKEMASLIERVRKINDRILMGGL